MFIEEDICSRIQGDAEFLAKCLPIVRKVLQHKEKSFSSLVSARDPYGVKNSSLLKYPIPEGSLTICGCINGNIIYQSVHADFLEKRKYTETIEQWKIFIPRTDNLDKIIIGKPIEICSDYFLVVGGFRTQSEVYYCRSYLETKFARFFILLRKYTRFLSKNSYDLLPVQDFSTEWTDDLLYKKYGFTKEDIDLIEQMEKN